MVAEALPWRCVQDARRSPVLGTDGQQLAACRAVQECWEWGIVTVLVGGERSLILPPLLPDQVFNGTPAKPSFRQQCGDVLLKHT
jgi:hypothetical protein